MYRVTSNNETAPEHTQKTWIAGKRKAIHPNERAIRAIPRVSLHASATRAMQVPHGCGQDDQSRLACCRKILTLPGPRRCPSQTISSVTDWNPVNCVTAAKWIALSRTLLITNSSRASSEIGKSWALHIMLHDILDFQMAITKKQGGLERVRRV